MRDHTFIARSREQIAADNRAELESWIDERAAEFAAQGVNPAEARSRALAEFGDLTGAERYAQGQDVAADRRMRVLVWVEELMLDLRIALRTFVRAPLANVVVLLTFALGIGATTAVFSVFHALLLRPLPYGEEETLVYLQALDNGIIGPNPRLSVAAMAALQERTTSFQGVTSIETGNVVISENGDPEQVMGALLSGNPFEVLQTRAAIGQTFTQRDVSRSSEVVVLSDELWRRRFGADRSIVGRTIALNGERRLVLGVMPPGVRVPTHEEAQFWAPRDFTTVLAHPAARHVRVVRVFGRLKPGVSLEAAQADVDRTMRQLQAEFPRSNDGVDARVVPIRTAVAGNFRLRLVVVMGAAVFVLLIACTNVAGIMLSRALARGHELSVRVALGAGRRRLIRQFLAEGAALALLGVILGLAIAQLGIVALRLISPAALPAGTTFGLEPRVLVFAIGLALISALAASLFPALGATRAPGIGLRRADSRVTGSSSSRRARLGLVAAQLAVSAVLLMGAGLFLRTLHQLYSLDLGYSTERALTFRLQFTRPRNDAEQDVFWTSLYQQLRALPGVASVGGGNLPLSGSNTTIGLEVEGRTVDHERLPDVRHSVASPDYFTTLGIPVLRGRTFTSADREGAPSVAVISAGLARQLWPDGDPIGARVKPGSGKPWSTVVGVVGDIRKGAADPAQPSVYTAQLQDHWPGGGTLIIRTDGDPASLTEAVRRIMKGLDPTLPIIQLRTLADFRRNTPAIAERRLQMQLVVAFALVALVVSAIGVFGVSAYAAQARRREFGIRMALGATRAAVLWLSLRDCARVALLGAGAGIPLALLLAARLQGTFYVSPLDPLTTGTVLGTLFLVALVASIVPARRAALTDPARTIRSE